MSAASAWASSSGTVNPSGSATPIAPQAGVDQLNSADYLTNAAKIALVNNWTQELHTQGTPSTVGSLDYQASQYGVSSAAYDAAVTALSAGLVTAGAPSNWATAWPDGTTFHAVGIQTSLTSWWATIAAARTALENAIGGGYVATAATQALADANAAVLQSQPHQVSWASTALPALPSGSYPAGYYALTTDHLTFQVNNAGTAWGQVYVGAKGLFDQLVAGQLTVANFDQLVPNPNSSGTQPNGQPWPAGSIEANGLGTIGGTNASQFNPPSGGYCRVVVGNNISHQDMPVTNAIPCKAGDVFNAQCYAGNLSGNPNSNMFFAFYDESKAGVSYANATATAGGILNLTATAPATVSNGMPPTYLYLIVTVGAGPGDNRGMFNFFYMRRCADANMIVDGTLLALMARIAKAIQSTNYVPGTTSAPPTGFCWSGPTFTSYLLDGTSFSANGEIGNGFNLAGYKVDGLAVAKLNGGGFVEWNTPGTYSWKCPANTTAVTLSLQAGGGSGAVGGGGGGAGGAIKIRVSGLTPGSTYTIVVGAAGSAVSGGGLATSGNSGGASTGLGISCSGGAGGSSSGNGGQGGGNTYQANVAGGAGAGTSVASYPGFNILLTAQGAPGGGVGFAGGGCGFNSGGNAGGGAGGGASINGGGGGGVGTGTANAGYGYGAGGGSIANLSGTSGAGGSGYARIDY